MYSMNFLNSESPRFYLTFPCGRTPCVSAAPGASLPWRFVRVMEATLPDDSGQFGFLLLSPIYRMLMVPLDPSSCCLSGRSAARPASSLRISW